MLFSLLIIVFFCFLERKELAKEELQKFKSIIFLSMTSGTGTPSEMVIRISTISKIQIKGATSQYFESFL